MTWPWIFNIRWLYRHQRYNVIIQQCRPQHICSWLRILQHTPGLISHPIAYFKLPSFNEQLASDVPHVLRRYSNDVQSVHKAGLSVRNMLWRCLSVLRCVQRKSRSRKRGRGWPLECCACDAGLVGGQCLLKGVVYAMCCTLCEGLYIGETAPPATSLCWALPRR